MKIWVSRVAEHDGTGYLGLKLDFTSKITKNMHFYRVSYLHFVKKQLIKSALEWNVFVKCCQVETRRICNHLHVNL